MSEFFAGTNTEVGFKGYLEEYFAPLQKVYIIKGTPGSGKSTLLKRLAAGCTEKGYEVHRIRCSSDPASLDGIILPEKGFAVADGTAPHVLEAKNPLAREILVDVGRFMDEKKIDSAAVLKAAERKSVHYARGYGYIKCAVAADRNRVSVISEGLDKEKLFAFANRFYGKNLRSAEKGGAVFRVASAFTGKGMQVCDPFPCKNRVFFIKGGRGCEGMFIDMLKEIAAEEKEKVTLCPHPTDSKKLSGIYFRGSGAYVTAKETENGEDLCLSRFFKKGELSDSRSTLKENGSLVKTAFLLAEKEFALAAEYHGVLEQNYISAMDFSHIEGEYTRLLKALTE